MQQYYQGVESDFEHVTFPDKKYKINESMCTYVQSKNTLVLTDRFANTVHMYDNVNGTSKAVTDRNILQPRDACVGPGDTVLVCSEMKDSIVHPTASRSRRPLFIFSSFSLEMYDY
ncbi:hypothetical protein DPMN_132069 [Dreissena polymorpha]|uniref:Uncharacterized protein n=1 Tax=Dreissena polymorpha TaxID=45954 RepID=A0A9D4FVF1_DREPO|nr:hypothetical protein DPMN_132069 [Dreissena polymorpha]